MIKRAATAILVIFALAATVAGCSEPAPADRPLVMGAPDTPTMTVMAHIYAGALRNAGSAVSPTVERGDYRTLLDDMDATSVDVFPAFSGLLLDQLAPQLAPATAEDVYKDLNRSLPQGVSVGDATMVSATPQIFVAASTAEATTATDLDDCGTLPAGLPVVVVGTPQASTMDAFAAAGCRFGPTESVDSVRDAVGRVATGRAIGILTPLDVAGDDEQDAASDIRALAAAEKSTTEGGVAQSSSVPSSPAAPSSAAPSSASAESAVVESGPRAQELVPVYRSAAFSRDEVKTLNKVAGELTTADLAALAREAIAGARPADLANEWLAEHGL
ncbi:glycine betaine ABC transporter substrate-binding protein [Gordonia sp. OPL2]|uniref:glycine betaine ABC transporter substrate-binding protein n=1 Tax=Gordonia sp. OPL2 TaxID=2486274 RepID=UPI0021CC9C30|nr:glycine betaine ABC transporter substrate-binding protein [Gordonia sp. OPL2]